jgi:hypothetical protein
MAFFWRDRKVRERNQDRLVIGKNNAVLHVQRLTCIHSFLFRKGGPLAVTDANLLLGRLIPDYFPKIFGKSEKEPLDVEASQSAFKKVAEEINDSHEKQLSLDEIVYGYVLF